MAIKWLHFFYHVDNISLDALELHLSCTNPFRCWLDWICLTTTLHMSLDTCPSGHISCPNPPSRSHPTVEIRLPYNHLISTKWCPNGIFILNQGLGTQYHPWKVQDTAFSHWCLATLLIPGQSSSLGLGWVVNWDSLQLNLIAQCQSHSHTHWLTRTGWGRNTANPTAIGSWDPYL